MHVLSFKYYLGISAGMTSVITAASGDPFTYFVALKYTASRARAFYERERKLSAKKATKGKRKMDRSILERKEKETSVIIPWTSAAPWARLERFLRTRWRTSSTTSRRFSSTRRSSQRRTFDLLSVVLNEDFLMVCLFIRFSEEANPSCFRKIRAESSSSITEQQQQQDNNKETRTNGE